MSLKLRPTETIQKPVLCIGLTDGKILSGRTWTSFQLKASIGRNSVNLPEESEFTNSIIRGASSMIGQRVTVTLTNETSVIGVGEYTIDGYMGILPSAKANGFDISVEDLKSLALTKKVSVNLGEDYS